MSRLVPSHPLVPLFVLHRAASAYARAGKKKHKETGKRQRKESHDDEGRRNQNETKSSATKFDIRPSHSFSISCITLCPASCCFRFCSSRPDSSETVGFVDLSSILVSRALSFFLSLILFFHSHSALRCILSSQMCPTLILHCVLFVVLSCVRIRMFDVDLGDFVTSACYSTSSWRPLLPKSNNQISLFLFLLSCLLSSLLFLSS